MTDTVVAVLWTLSWQLAGLTVLLWAGERLLHIRQPRTRHALWWTVLLAPLLLAPVRFSLAKRQALFHLPAAAPVAQIVRVTQMRTLRPLLTPAIRPTRSAVNSLAAPSMVVNTAAQTSPALGMADWLTLVWFLGVALMLVRLGRGHLRARRLVAGSQPVEGAARAMLDALCQDAGLRIPVELHTSLKLASPALYGLTRPVILVPQDWAEAVSLESLRGMLAHELAHVKGRDLLLRLLQGVAVSLLWFHPGAWLANNRIVSAREECCDAWAVLHGAEPVAYAQALLAAAERMQFRGAAVSIGLAEERSTLLGRVEMLLHQGKPRRGGRLGAALGICLLAVCVPAFGLVAAPRAEVLNRVRPSAPGPQHYTVRVIALSGTFPLGKKPVFPQWLQLPKGKSWPLVSPDPAQFVRQITALKPGVKYSVLLTGAFTCRQGKSAEAEFHALSGHADFPFVVIQASIAQSAARTYATLQWALQEDAHSQSMVRTYMRIGTTAVAAFSNEQNGKDEGKRNLIIVSVTPGTVWQAQEQAPTPGRPR